MVYGLATVSFLEQPRPGYTKLGREILAWLGPNRPPGSLPRIAKTGPLIRNSGIRKWALDVYSQRETASTVAMDPGEPWDMDLLERV